MSVDVRVLGPVEVRVADRVVPLPPLVRRLVALLAVEAGRVVAVPTLIAELWPGEPPPSARNRVQQAVAGLRRALSGAGGDQALIATTPPGYLLDPQVADVDVTRFGVLVESARAYAAREDPEAAAAAFREALGLWRGRAYGGVTAARLELESARLAELRGTALEECVAVELSMGRHRELIAELGALVADDPLRERVRGQLMLALYRSGRIAEALATYRDGYERATSEVGVEPGTELQELHQAMLTRQGWLTASDRAVPRPRTPRQEPPPRVKTNGHRPAQLPADIAAFVGRQRHLDELDQLLQDARGTAVPICALSGGAGVGKTTLSVHWAHRVAPRFPDGQLYVNLRGFDRRDGALDPLEVMRGFLDALGVLPSQVPDAAEPLVGLYRTVLSDRRLLILLDNARNAEQVRPLLPGARGCVVVVNSRDRLTGLVAIECAHPLTVELLSDAEAWELLSRRIGRTRLAAEPLAAQEIVDRCGGLPVVLSIVAARVATQPDYPLVAASHHLGSAHSGLDGLGDGDAAADIRAAFASSYRTLGESAARMFRLLGLHPGPAMSGAAAASLAGEPPSSARRRMAELARLHLVNTSVPDEYTMHDLLRAYAAELVDECDSEADRQDAVRRLLDHYLHTAHDAALLVDAGREPLELAPARAAVATVAMTTPEQAEAWFSTERPTLAAAIRLAHDCALWTHAWQLAWVFAAFCERRGHYRDQVNTQLIALEAARRSADPAGLAHAHRGLARVRYRTGHYDEALAHLVDALELHAALDDTIGLARTHFGLGTLYICLGRYEEALHHNRLALDLFRKAGSRSGEAEALNGVGWSHARNGQYEQAVELGEQAVELCQQLGITSDEACTWDTLGYAHQHLGHHTDAAHCYERAVRLYQATGERHLEAETLEHLGAGRLAAGDAQWAHRAWSDALAILDDLRHPDADQLRLRLAGLPRPS